MDTQKPTQASYNTTDLASDVAKSFNLSRAQALKIVTATFALVANAVSRGELVRLHSFGNLKPLQTKERKGRNPKTGEETVIQASVRPHFVVSQNFKDLVREGKQITIDVAPAPVAAAPKAAKPAVKAQPKAGAPAPQRRRVPIAQGAAAPAASPEAQVDPIEEL